MNMSNEILHVPVENILPNRFQPREHFADDGIEELAKSIKEHGIIQPLVLRPLGDKYEIVAGERRYKAACMAGLSEVPAVISNIDDNQSAEIALVENIQRRNLTSIEEARSFKSILDKGYLTQDQLAQKMGISQSAIANKLRLLNLCDEVQEALMTEKISERHARALLSVTDQNEQKMWLARILKERLTVRQLDVELKKIGVEDAENSDIPLVSLTPDIEKIRENAMDIKPIIEPKHLDNLLTPDENINQIDEKNKPVVEEPTVEEPTEPLNTNRFFNFLEDMGPNMNMAEPEPAISNEEFSNRVFDDLNKEIDTPEEISTNNTDVTQVTNTDASFVKPYDQMINNDSIINPYDQINTNNALTASVNPYDQLGADGNTSPFDFSGMNISSNNSIETPLSPVTAEPIEELEVLDDFTSSPGNFEPIENNNFNTPSVNSNMNTIPVENNIPDVIPTVETFSPVVNNEPLNAYVAEAPINNGMTNSVELFEANSVSSNTDALVNSSNELNNYYNPYDQQIESVTNENVSNSQLNEATPINPFAEAENDTEQNHNDVDINIFPTNAVNEYDNKKIVIDPMSVIDRLDPNKEEEQAVIETNNLTDAINQVRDKVKDLERKGFLINVEELDLNDKYQIILNIDK